MSDNVFNTHHLTAEINNIDRNGPQSPIHPTAAQDDQWDFDCMRGPSPTPTPLPPVDYTVPQGCQRYWIFREEANPTDEYFHQYPNAQYYCVTAGNDGSLCINDIPPPAGIRPTR